MSVLQKLVGVLVGVSLGYAFPGSNRYGTLFIQIYWRLCNSVLCPMVLVSVLLLINKVSLPNKVTKADRLNLALAFSLLAIPFVGYAYMEILKGQQHVHLNEFLDSLLPESIVRALSENQYGQVMLFSAMFGLAIRHLEPAHRDPVLPFFTSLFDILMHLVKMLLYVSPMAIAAGWCQLLSQN